MSRFRRGCLDTTSSRKIDSSPLYDEGFFLSHAETFCSSFSRRLTGFKITSAIGDQFLVPPDHRAGFFRLASS